MVVDYSTDGPLEQDALAVCCKPGFILCRPDFQADVVDGIILCIVHQHTHITFTFLFGVNNLKIPFQLFVQVVCAAAVLSPLHYF